MPYFRSLKKEFWRKVEENFSGEEDSGTEMEAEVRYSPAQSRREENSALETGF